MSSLRYRPPTFVPLYQLRLTDTDTRSKLSDHLGETRRVADNDEGNVGFSARNETRAGGERNMAASRTCRLLDFRGYSRWKAAQKGGTRAFGVTRYAGKELKIRAGWKAFSSEIWPGKKGGWDVV